MYEHMIHACIKCCDLLQWAYGVTCWEIFSGGKVPYGGVDVTDLSQLLVNGRRLDKPNNDACSDQL